MQENGVGYLVAERESFMRIKIIDGGHEGVESISTFPTCSFYSSAHVVQARIFPIKGMRSGGREGARVKENERAARYM